MMLKRLYNKEAPASEWLTVEEECPTCQGKGVVINDALDGVVDCQDCEGGVRLRTVPPIVGVEILHAGDVQHFSPRLVKQGESQGWMRKDGANIVLSGSNEILTYKIVGYPWPVGDRKVHYYDCELVNREDVS